MANPEIGSRGPEEEMPGEQQERELTPEEQAAIQELWTGGADGKKLTVGEIVEKTGLPWGVTIRYLKETFGGSAWPTEEDLKKMDEEGASPEEYFEKKEKKGE